MKLAAKIALASQLIGKVPKNGENTHFKFRYQAWDDVVPAVRDACATAGIALIPSMYLVRSENGHTVVQVTVRIVDTEGDEEYTVDTVGESKGNDDKGLQKAFTSAYKYALLKLFLIPVHGDEDPDGAPASPTPASVPQRPPSGKKVMDAAVAHLLEVTGLDKAGLRDLLAGASVVATSEAVRDAGATTLEQVKAIIEGLKGGENVE
jgi:hypothetical protein